jgi:hypothetical protein
MIASCGVLMDATVSTILLPTHFGAAVNGGVMRLAFLLIALVGCRSTPSQYEIL